MQLSSRVHNRAPSTTAASIVAIGGVPIYRTSSNGAPISPTDDIGQQKDATDQDAANVTEYRTKHGIHRNDPSDVPKRGRSKAQ